MMMMDWKTVYAQQERLYDMRLDAEQYRLVRSLQRLTLPSSVCRLMAWLGRRLIAWGDRLQQRYDAVEGRPTALSA